MFLVNLLRSDWFGNLNIVENVVDCLVLIDLHQFLLHICIVNLAMFRLLRGKILHFVSFQLLFFVSLIRVGFSTESVG